MKTLGVTNVIQRQDHVMPTLYFKETREESRRNSLETDTLDGCRQQWVVYLFIHTTHADCASKLFQLHLHGIYLMQFTHGLVIFYLAAVMAS